MTKCIFIIITFILFTNFAFGCSLAVSPTSSFEADHYIFIGEVVEVINPVKPLSKRNKAETEVYKPEAVGLKIKVSDNVYSPKKASFYEVFPLRLYADCSVGNDTKEILENYPVGSQVRVVASEAKFFRNQSESSLIRLETSIYNQGSFARNDLNEDLRTSARSIYDYKSFIVRKRTTAAEDSLFDSSYYLPEFELRKDLFRLSEAKSEAEITEILERLVFYPHVYSINFPFISRSYLKNQDKLATFEKKWEQRVKEFYSKQK